MYFPACYIFIFFCFLLCAIRHFPFLRIPQMRLLPCALFFTVCADYFLIFTDSVHAGILLFCLVQLCYRIFLGGTWQSLLKSCLFVFLFLLPLGSLFDAVLVPAACYLGLLCTNIHLARIHKNFRFLHALTLMFLCDIHVGIANLPGYLALPPSVWYSFSARLFWFFYLPSQFLISSSPLSRR